MKVFSRIVTDELLNEKLVVLLIPWDSRFSTQVESNPQRSYECKKRKENLNFRLSENELLSSNMAPPMIKDYDPYLNNGAPADLESCTNATLKKMPLRLEKAPLVQVYA